MDPIHKFNGGTGATLCHNCGIMISEGMNEALYCLDCEVKVFKSSIDEWMKKPKNERDKDIELAKQEQRYKAYIENTLSEFNYNLMAKAWREDDEEEFKGWMEDDEEEDNNDDDEYSDNNEE